jgi:hypothetical protein
MLPVLVILISLPLTLEAQGNTTESNVPKFIAIQHADSGLISQINDTAYSLELSNVSQKTILFSDRPDRIVRSISTHNFVGNWSIGEDSFTEDEPNTVIVVHDIEGQESAIIELSNPVYNLDEKKLMYVFTPDNTTSIELPHDLGQSTLVIDGVKHPTQY